MSDIYLNPTTNDIELVNSRMSVTKLKEELARQKLAITLKSFRGEWFANALFGVPYLANDYNNVQLLEKNTKDLLDLEIKSVILGIEGILELISYNSSLSDNRVLEINFTALTDSGVEITIDDLTIS